MHTTRNATQLLLVDSVVASTRPDIKACADAAGMPGIRVMCYAELFASFFYYRDH